MDFVFFEESAVGVIIDGYWMVWLSCVLRVLVLTVGTYGSSTFVGGGYCFFASWRFRRITRVVDAGRCGRRLYGVCWCWLHHEEISGVIL